MRDTECRANLLHSLPSDPMRTDALAQFFVKKRWSDLVMISGSYPADQAYANAMRRSLKKFGMTLSGEKVWDFDAECVQEQRQDSQR